MPGMEFAVTVGIVVCENIKPLFRKIRTEIIEMAFIFQWFKYMSGTDVKGDGRIRIFNSAIGSFCFIAVKKYLVSNYPDF
jgi:hypothetical protein